MGQVSITRAAREVTAYHEAGHAVMIMATGFTVLGIRIGDNDGDGGFTRWSSPPDHLMTKAQKALYVLCIAAGVAADYTHGYDAELTNSNDVPLGHFNDQEQAAPYLRYLGHGGEFFTYVTAASGLLMNRWEVVTEIANALLASGAIKDRQVIDSLAAKVKPLDEESAIEMIELARAVHAKGA